MKASYETFLRLMQQTVPSQGLAWLLLQSESCECLTASSNSNWAQAAEAWSSLPHWQAQITTRFKVVLW